MSPAGSACLFCQIVAGEVPAARVYETDEVVAFRDNAPKAPTHVLVIPKRHVDDVHAVVSDDGPLLAQLLGVVQAVAEAEGIVAGGYRVVANVGTDAGNTVPHLHLHVLGGRELAWPPG